MVVCYFYNEGKDVSLYTQSFNEFYTKVKKKVNDPFIQKYIQSMQQATKIFCIQKKKRYEGFIRIYEEKRRTYR